METWLACEVSLGQFSGEFAVNCVSYQGVEFSLFVPEEFVELKHSPSLETPVEGRLRVEVISQNKNLRLIRLPRETLENGRTITVDQTQLHQQPSRQEA